MTNGEDAVAHGDVVLFSVPWWGVEETLREAGSLEGKVLIDCTNPYTDASYALVAHPY